MSANTAELLQALWPIFAAIVAGFAVGVYVWANTKRDSRDALEASAAASKAATRAEGKVTALELALSRETAALESRIVALETRQADILQAVLYIKDNMLLKQRNAYSKGRNHED